MTTAPVSKLYGKDLSEYEEMDVDELLTKLTPEELAILAKEVDPDVSELILLKVYEHINHWSQSDLVSQDLNKF